MSASTAPRTAISQARRRTLIDATIEVVADQGLAGASVAKIADEAGMSKPAVLYHVTSRDVLVEEAVSEVLEEYGARVAQSIEAPGDPRARLFAYVEDTLRYLWARPTHLRVVVEVAYHEPSRRGGRAGRVSDVTGLIESGNAAGVLAASDAPMTAAAIIGALDALLVHGLSGNDEHRENLIGEAVGLVDRIVTPR